MKLCRAYLVVFILIIMSCGIFTLCSCEKNNDDNVISDEEIQMEMFYKLYFAWDFGMHSNNSLLLAINEVKFQKNQNINIIFVHSKEEMDEILESDEICEDNIYAYPSEETEACVNKLNTLIKHKNLEISSYDLEYPITIDDVIENALNVSKLLYNREVVSLSEYTYISKQ